MNIIHLRREDVGKYLNNLHVYDDDLIYKFLHDYLLKDTSLNLVRLRPNGIDGVQSNIPNTSIHKNYKHWNCNWIYVTDHSWKLLEEVPQKTKNIIKDEKV